MLGGVLIGHGNNTCVYNPPIECADGSPIPSNHVSRIVPEDSKEPVVQEKLKAAFQNMDPKYLKHFNLATKICTAKFKPSDLANPCTVEALNDQVKVGPTRLINMLTPIQESDINRREDSKFYKPIAATNAGFRDFLHAIVEMNSYSVQVFHTDAHVGNVSWLGKNIVLHDWEKCQIGDENLLQEINGSTPHSWNLLGYVPDRGERAYLAKYPCWLVPLTAMEPFDNYDHIFPPNHTDLHLIHQIYFRFWDTFSIVIPVLQMYTLANIQEPAFINKICTEAMGYFFDVFYDEFKNPDTSMNETAKKVKLDSISNKLHEIIDEAFAEMEESDNLPVNAELLKLVAQHSHNSPSKAVLYNMLPKVKNGGTKRRSKPKSKTKRRSKRPT
jgi:hypothetical protein